MITDFDLLLEKLMWRYDIDKLKQFYDKIRVAASFKDPISSYNEIKEGLRECLDYRGGKTGPEWHTDIDELRTIIFHKCKTETYDYGDLVCVGRYEKPEWLAVVTYKEIDGHLDLVYVTIL